MKLQFSFILPLMIGESHSVTASLEPLLKTPIACKLLTCTIQTDQSSTPEIQNRILEFIPALWKTKSIHDIKVLKSERGYFKLLIATMPEVDSDTEKVLKSHLNDWAASYDVKLQIIGEMLELVE